MNDEEAYPQPELCQAMYDYDKYAPLNSMVDKENPPHPVSSPRHYAKGGIECILAIKASMTPEEFKGYLKGNVIKYLWRFEDKGNPVQDLNKAAKYIEWLEEFVKTENITVGK